MPPSSFHVERTLVPCQPPRANFWTRIHDLKLASNGLKAAGMELGAYFSLTWTLPDNVFANSFGSYSYFYPLHALRFLPCQSIHTASTLRPQKWGQSEEFHTAFDHLFTASSAQNRYLWTQCGYGDTICSLHILPPFSPLSALPFPLCPPREAPWRVAVSPKYPHFCG